jgi:oxygen-independent coproporphyrinogen-3 oxidase
MIGLGVSSISDSWYGFAQNEKSLEDYYTRIDENELPVYRGHKLTEEDRIIRKHILNLMCNFETSWHNEDEYLPELLDIILSLEEMKNDGLIEFSKDHIRVTDKGKPYVRNICMAFDLRMRRKLPETQLFSMVI